MPGIAASAGLARRIDADGVALTFDDGPHPTGTPAVLDVLDAAGARASFFLAGEQVERYPAVAREIATRGHLVAVHCHRHRVQLRVRESELRDDLERALAVIGEATGASPTFHRPPLGIYSRSGLRIAREHSLVPLLWSRWGKDWRKWTTPERIARRAADGIQAGDVVLLHDADHYSARDSWRRTVEALPRVLESIDRAGLRTCQPTGSTSAGAAVSHSK